MTGGNVFLRNLSFSGCLRMWMALVQAVVLMATGAVCVAQNLPETYVRSAVFTKPLTELPDSLEGVARTSITYYDGLGRPVQTVKQRAGGNGRDLLSLTEYDAYGNPYRQWLEVEGSGSDGKCLNASSLKNEVMTFYGDNYPYKETIYERSPEMKVEQEILPGQAWRNREKSIFHMRGLNTEEDAFYNCPMFIVDADGALVLNGNYPSGRLHYENIINEDDVDAAVFTDRDERKVLERQYLSGSTLDTYYVHDFAGRLTYVIPPKAAALLPDNGNGVCDTAVVRKLCYQYSYDQYNRIISKRLPGAEPEFFVYDKMDNVLFSQDGNLRKKSQWRVTKLDEKRRKAVEGIATMPGATRESLQETWKYRMAKESRQTAGSFMEQMYYSDTCGISGFEPKVAYFYDNYDYFKKITGKDMPSDDDYPSGMENATGMLTCKLVWEDWYLVLISYTYDDRKRIVLEHEFNLDGMWELTSFNKYDFAGDLIGKKTVYQNNDLMLTFKSEFAYTYDDWGSLLSVEHKINDGAWTELYSYEYDDVKRLKSKTVYPRAADVSAQTTSYDYNLRGWMTSLNSPFFRQRLHYNDSIAGSTPRWSGSPSAMMFTVVNASGELDSCRVVYGYDAMERLLSVTPTTSSGDSHTFRESFEYDENGNPLVITRGNTAGLPVQYISLSYDGNQISALNETKTAEGVYSFIPSIVKGDYETGWTYDANGNRTADPSRGISSISYNLFNQPEKFTFSDGSTLTNLYRSDGTMYGRTEREKVMSTVSGGSSSSYTFKTTGYTFVGDFVVEDYTPAKMYFNGGYIDLFVTAPTSVTTSYKYYVHDNQGSVRAVVNQSGALVQAADYSAYGVPSTRYRMTADNRLHLGLEWQPMKGLYGYYNNARFRDALLAGMFFQIDPLAEKYYPFSPYHYAAANPLRFVDVNGRDIWELDVSGYAHKIIDDKEIDEIRMVDENGNPILNDNGKQISISFNYRTIESYRMQKIDQNKSFDVYKVRGDDNAKAMFEFMSENITGSETMVEIGLAKTGVEGDKGLNFITTSHTPKEEYGLGELYRGQLCNGYTIREFIHSHPLGNGIGEYDFKMKANIIGFQFDFNLPIPQFSIYYQPDKKYLKY